MKRSIVMNWEVGSNFGWGILGLNVFLHWANDPELQPLMGFPISADAVASVDPLRLSRASPALIASNEFVDKLQRTGDMPRYVDGVVIDPIANDLKSSSLFGQTNIGRCIFEFTELRDAKRRLEKYDALLCGSVWNAELLKTRTGQDVQVIHEGVDQSLFCPGPKSGLMDPGLFYVFSGGKIEHRKGQDLVLLAFREFARRHDDARLVTAWHSPYPKIAVGYQGRLTAPVTLDAQGMLNVKRWIADNGIDPRQVIEIFSIPNQLMPPILREMDVALQPSRAEACTNLPVKEAMACGVPVIVADNTGMRDLITADNCVALEDQRPVSLQPGLGSEGWGESNVEEIIDALETLYTDRERRLAIGRRSAEWVRDNRTWSRHAHALKAFVLQVA